MKAAGSRALSAASSGARSALGSAAPWAWSRACSARLIIIARGIHGARTNQVRRASPAASHVVSNVFPPARVNAAPLHLRRKIGQPCKRRCPHGPLSLLPPRRKIRQPLKRRRPHGPQSLLPPRRKIRQPLKRRRLHGPLPLLPTRRRASHWSEHSH